MKFLVSFINKLHACLIFVILHLILRKSKFRANFLFSEQHIAVEIKKTLKITFPFTISHKSCF